MCAIVDNSARDEVFGDAPTERGLRFLRWVNDGHTQLALGGRLRNELVGDGTQTGSANFRDWLRTAGTFGRLLEPAGDVDVETRLLDSTRNSRGDRLCRSNDPHVLALARVSGARLPFTNDGNLMRDFQNNEIIRRPPGKIYPHEGFNEFLLDRRNRNLCARR